MALKNRSSQRHQPFRNRSPPQIRPADHIAKIQQNLGNPTHANPANSDEMYPLRLRKHNPERYSISHPATKGALSKPILHIRPISAPQPRNNSTRSKSHEIKSISTASGHRTLPQVHPTKQEESRMASP